MTSQADFWKPQPYDFEGLADRVDIANLTVSHRLVARMHGRRGNDRFMPWGDVETAHDAMDANYFHCRNMGRYDDIWDNRRKVTSV